MLQDLTLGFVNIVEVYRMIERIEGIQNEGVASVITASYVPTTILYFSYIAARNSTSSGLNSR